MDFCPRMIYIPWKTILRRCTCSRQARLSVVSGPFQSDDKSNLSFQLLRSNHLFQWLTPIGNGMVGKKLPPVTRRKPRTHDDGQALPKGGLIWPWLGLSKIDIDHHLVSFFPLKAKAFLIFT